jgi:curved DNA-binding protein CbpA
LNNLYEILGVAPDCPQKEIKDAYRRHVKAVHPDLNNGDPSSVERMKDLVRAYEILGNPARREEYDRTYGSSFTHREFDYGEFLRERSDDRESQAKLVFYDLLHDNPDEALQIYDSLVAAGDFELSRYLGREDFMDCAFLLAEEYESRSDYRRAFDLLAAIVRFERQKPYFRHFMVEVHERLRTVVCFKMPEVYDAFDVLDSLHRLIDWDLSRRDTAFFLKKAAEIYLEQGNRRRAVRYLQRGLELDDKLSGVKKLKQELGYSETA